jgi:hypothetical protein
MTKILNMHEILPPSLEKLKRINSSPHNLKIYQDSQFRLSLPFNFYMALLMPISLEYMVRIKSHLLPTKASSKLKQKIEN